MDELGLAIVITDLVDDLEALTAASEADLNRAKTAAQQIDNLEVRLQAIVATIRSDPLEEIQPISQGQIKAPSRPSLGLPERTWAEIRAAAEANLRQRGIDVTQVNLDSLLDVREVARLEQRFQGGFRLAAQIDSYDLAFAAVAGLTAALVDFLVVRIPRDTLYLGQDPPQMGSMLAGLWKKLELPSDNWLSQYFKTAYDHTGGSGHRLDTLGHDPLLGLVFGTIDILRGGTAKISNSGHLEWLTQTGAADHNPITAFVTQILHMLSDGLTTMGLPAPGWPLLKAFQIGSFGEKSRTIADLARYMYFKGYDSRHFLTMSTSVAAAEVVLRGYFSIRRKMDPLFAQEYDHLSQVAGVANMGEHPRYQAVALSAYLVAAAANVGKVAVYQGNPLAINYAVWLRFFHAAFRYVNMTLRAPTAVLTGHAYANWRALDDGWPNIDVNAADFPSLIVG